MRVFVTGATGFIGSAVAAAFARAGHETYGLARNPAKARLLEAAEIVPVAGTMEEPDGLALRRRPLLRPRPLRRRVLREVAGTSTAPPSARCATPGATAPDASSSPRAASGSTATPATAPSTRPAPLDPPTFVAPRPAVDAAVLSWNGGGFRTLVIRPGCVYGGAGSLHRRPGSRAPGRAAPPASSATGRTAGRWSTATTSPTST